MNKLYSLISQAELPYFGYNLSGFPLGVDGDYRRVIADENFDDVHDPLVEIKDTLLTRPMYFEQGFTQDKRLFLREPALAQWAEFDDILRRNFGWRVRICDAFRPWTIQQKGFCWGMNEVVKNRKEMSLDDFKKWLKSAVEGEADPKTLPLLEAYIQDTDLFFSFVEPEPTSLQNFDRKASLTIIIAAANMELIDLPLNKYTNNAHSTGGHVDAEWIDEGNGLLVNMGVPVDTQGLEAAMPFMEDRIAPVLMQSLKEQKLESVEARQQFYRQQVQQKPFLQKYLEACGVDVPQLLESDAYLKKIWEEIKMNRRVIINIATMIGLYFFAFESWDAACNDARGGVRAQHKKIISGPGVYALHMGQQECAWGNAVKLWEKI